MSSAGVEPDTRTEGEQDKAAIKALAALSSSSAPLSNLLSGNQVMAQSQQEEEAVGHDSSQLLRQPDAIPPDSAAAAQHIADNREPSYTRQDPTTSQIRQAPENSTIASLKHEHSSRTQSPLRESSIPVPSTEMPASTASSAQKAKPKTTNKKGIAAAASKRRTTKSKKPADKKLGSATPARSSPAPRSVRTASSPRSSPGAEGDGEQVFSENEQEEEGDPVSDSELYCLCRRPDTGTFMIGCDGGCDDWFHGKCVGIQEKDKHLIDRYICPRCEEKGLGVTTWKRMCRRDGCRVPAKVQNGSKYCSEECGVLFFKELLAAKTRQVPQVSSRNAKKGHQPVPEDLGARGGLLSKGEIKALLNAAPTLEEFKRLGDGALSPPTASPNPDSAAATTTAPEDTTTSHESALNDIERERIEQISKLKETARARHALLKDKAKFVTMLKQSATQLAEDRNLKPKELCGFDARLTWNEDEFNTWRSSPEGQEALGTGVLAPLISTAADADGDAAMGDGAVAEPCTKRKCIKHYDWAKLALDDTRFETGDNGEFMRALDREENEIRERARLRAREIRAGGVGGTVEFHDEALKEAGKDSSAVFATAAVEDMVVEVPAGSKENDVKVEVSDVKENAETAVSDPKDGDEQQESADTDMIDAAPAAEATATV